MKDVITIHAPQQSAAAQRIECASFESECKEAKQNVGFGPQKISCR